jgi:hypothetical protein
MRRRQSENLLGKWSCALQVQSRVGSGLKHRGEFEEGERSLAGGQWHEAHPISPAAPAIRQSTRRA